MHIIILYIPIETFIQVIELQEKENFMATVIGNKGTEEQPNLIEIHVYDNRNYCSLRVTQHSYIESLASNNY